MTELLELGTLMEGLFLGITGSYLMIGLLLFLTIIGFLVIMRVGIEGGIAVGVPTMFLVFEFVPEAKIIFGIIWGMLLGLALLKLMNR